MKKVVPDPPEDLRTTFQIPPDQSLASAIFEGRVPIEEVLSNACHHMLFAYTDAFHAHEAAADAQVRQLLSAGLRSLEVALGQVDALVGALRRVPESGFYVEH